jgi:REP element-mobilizing transposase RayT
VEAQSYRNSCLKGRTKYKTNELHKTVISCRFCTKYRKKTIPEQHEKELYAYIMGIINNKKSKLDRIGGTENHLHLLFGMHSTLALSDFMREIKEHSSKWLGQNPNFRDFEGWAVSFAAFTYNLNNKQTIANYIGNQKEHHQTVSFEDEYRQFITDNGVVIDEKYFLKE